MTPPANAALVSTASTAHTVARAAAPPRRASAERAANSTVNENSIVTTMPAASDTQTTWSSRPPSMVPSAGIASALRRERLARDHATRHHDREQEQQRDADHD